MLEQLHHLQHYFLNSPFDLDQAHPEWYITFLECQRGIVIEHVNQLQIWYVCATYFIFSSLLFLFLLLFLYISSFPITEFFVACILPFLHSIQKQTLYASKSWKSSTFIFLLIYNNVRKSFHVCQILNYAILVSCIIKHYMWYINKKSLSFLFLIVFSLL